MPGRFFSHLQLFTFFWLLCLWFASFREIPWWLSESWRSDYQKKYGWPRSWDMFGRKALSPMKNQAIFGIVHNKSNEHESNYRVTNYKVHFILTTLYCMFYWCTFEELLCLNMTFLIESRTSIMGWRMQYWGETFNLNCKDRWCLELIAPTNRQVINSTQALSEKQSQVPSNIRD